VSVETRVFKAEYISCQDDVHYLNVDLGFGVWKVVPMDLKSTLDLDLKFNDKLEVLVTKEGRRPDVYWGLVKEYNNRRLS